MVDVFCFFAILAYSTMITSIHFFFYCILNLLSFIVTMYWTEFLYELYSDSRVLVYYIESHFFVFFVSIIGCHNYSYSAILNSFL